MDDLILLQFATFLMAENKRIIKNQHLLTSELEGFLAAGIALLKGVNALEKEGQ